MHVRIEQPRHHDLALKIDFATRTAERLLGSDAHDPLAGNSQTAANRTAWSDYQAIFEKQIISHTKAPLVKAPLAMKLSSASRTRRRRRNIRLARRQRMARILPPGLAMDRFERARIEQLLQQLWRVMLHHWPLLAKNCRTLVLDVDCA